MESELEKDAKFIEQLRPYSIGYIECVALDSGWEKSTMHFEICKILCMYITDSDHYKVNFGTLKLKIHEITSEITDRLDKSIGLPVPRGYVEATINKKDIPLYANRLSISLIKQIKLANKEELLKLVW